VLFPLCHRPAFKVYSEISKRTEERFDVSEAGYMKRANLQGTSFLLSRVDILAHINCFNDTQSEASFTRDK
jgi:hypothetical protein